MNEPGDTLSTILDQHARAISPVGPDLDAIRAAGRRRRWQRRAAWTAGAAAAVLAVGAPFALGGLPQADAPVAPPEPDLEMPTVSDLPAGPAPEIPVLEQQRRIVGPDGGRDVPPPPAGTFYSDFGRTSLGDIYGLTLAKDGIAGRVRIVDDAGEVVYDEPGLPYLATDGTTTAWTSVSGDRWTLHDDELPQGMPIPNYVQRLLAIDDRTVYVAAQGAVRGFELDGGYSITTMQDARTVAPSIRLAGGRTDLIAGRDEKGWLVLQAPPRSRPWGWRLGQDERPVRLSADGRFLLTADNAGGDDTAVTLYDVRTRTSIVRWELTTEGAPLALSDVMYEPDGDVLITVQDDEAEAMVRLTRQGEVERVAEPAAIAPDGAHPYVLGAQP